MHMECNHHCGITEMEENNDNLCDTFKTFARAACVCMVLFAESLLCAQRAFGLNSASNFSQNKGCMENIKLNAKCKQSQSLH